MNNVYKKEIEDTVLNEKNTILVKRQSILGSKLKEIITKYKQLENKNQDLFQKYHNDLYKNTSESDIPNEIKYFSDELNKLELFEYDFNIIVVGNKTLLDFILENKPYLKLKNFSLGGSESKVGEKILEKIILSNDEEYIKYLSEIGFYGSPELFLKDINNKKVIDYLIDNYNLYYSISKFNLNIIDFNTKKYIFNKFKMEKIDIDKVIFILDKMKLNVSELIDEIEISGNKISILEIYLNKDILKNKDMLNNVILSEKIVNSLIKKYFSTKNDILKTEIKECLNHSYIDQTTIGNLDKTIIENLKTNGIFLNIYSDEEYENNDLDSLLDYKLNELKNELKKGIETSDELINYLIYYYKQAYNNNSIIVLKEIETLILIKRNNPKFHIEDSNIGPNFDNDTLHLILSDKKHKYCHDNDNGLVLHHELTHSFQYYCVNDNYPQDYMLYLPNKENVLNQISNFVQRILLKIIEFRESIKDRSSEEIEKEMLNYTLNDLGYERSLIDIFDCTYPFTDFLTQLGIKEFEYIEGHPYDYINYNGYGFAEILAEYKTLLFSNRADLLDVCRKVLGDKFIEFIENWYEKMLDDYINIYSKDFTKKINVEKVKIR